MIKNEPEEADDSAADNRQANRETRKSNSNDDSS